MPAQGLWSEPDNNFHITPSPLCINDPNISPSRGSHLSSKFESIICFPIWAFRKEFSGKLGEKPSTSFNANDQCLKAICSLNHHFSYIQGLSDSLWMDNSQRAPTCNPSRHLKPLPPKRIGLMNNPIQAWQGDTRLLLWIHMPQIQRWASSQTHPLSQNTVGSERKNFILLNCLANCEQASNCRMKEWNALVPDLILHSQASKYHDRSSHFILQHNDTSHEMRWSEIGSIIPFPDEDSEAQKDEETCSCSSNLQIMVRLPGLASKTSSMGESICKGRGYIWEFCTFSILLWT